MSAATTTRLLERIAARADEAEVYEVRTDTLEIDLKNGQPKSALARETSGVAARAIKGGKLGFAGATDRTERGEARFVENLFNSLALGDEAGFSFPGAARAATTSAALKVWDDRVAKLGAADLIRLAEEAMAPIKARFPEVVLDVSVSRAVVSAKLENSRGAGYEDRGTAVSVSIEFNRTRENDVLLDGDGWSSSQLEEPGRREMVERVLQKLEWSRSDVKLDKPGRLPVLLTPTGGALVWGPAFAGLSGLTVKTGTSPVREKLGQRVLDERITIEDDPLAPGLLGSATYDEEGLPRRKNVLFDRGVLKTFVHDLKTAAATKQEPTASGERGGIFGAPTPGFSNIIIGGGDRSLDELLRGIDRGILVESVIGMGQGNTLSGAFSNTVGLAWLIEKGEVRGRIKDVSLAGNVYEALGPGGALIGLSRERQTHGSRVLPWVLLELNVVGKGQA